MAVTSMLTVDSESVSKFNVTGSTYDPKDGTFEGAQKSGSATTMASIICSLCNDSLLFANDAEEIKDGEEVLRDGSPTEAALRVLAEKIGFFEGMIKLKNMINVVCVTIIDIVIYCCCDFLLNLVFPLINELFLFLFIAYFKHKPKISVILTL